MVLCIVTSFCFLTSFCILHCDAIGQYDVIQYFRVWRLFLVRKCVRGSSTFHHDKTWEQCQCACSRGGPSTWKNTLRHWIVYCDVVMHRDVTCFGMSLWRHDLHGNVVTLRTHLLSRHCQNIVRTFSDPLIGPKRSNNLSTMLSSSQKYGPG